MYDQSCTSCELGGIMSVFLMGVYDKSCDQWKTVAKCGNGHDDATIDRLQKELDTIKISKVTGHHDNSIVIQCS